MTKKTWRSAARSLAGMIGLVATIGVAEAQTCDPRWPTVQFARDNLQRTASEGDLLTAQDYAERTRRQFDHLAELSTRCGCDAAAAKFGEAAKQIRPAQAAESRKAMREFVAATRPIFDAAMAQLQECARR